VIGDEIQREPRVDEAGVVEALALPLAAEQRDAERERQIQPIDLD
jgi:hypothetical protein